MQGVQTVSHTHSNRGDALMEKNVPHLDDFPEDVQNVVYEIMATAIQRAIDNGSYIPPEEDVEGCSHERSSESCSTDSSVDRKTE